MIDRSNQVEAVRSGIGLVVDVGNSRAVTETAAEVLSLEALSLEAVMVQKVDSHCVLGSEAIESTLR